MKNESAIKVIGQLEEALWCNCRVVRPPKAVQREVNYFREHEDRMDYRAGRRRVNPLAAARWKRCPAGTSAASNVPGRFWSQTGDEALLCLETLQRNR